MLFIGAVAARTAAIAAANEAKVKALTKQANEQVDALVTDAMAALKAGDLEAAKAKVDSSLSVPRADALASARLLDQQIRTATDPARITEKLMELSDADFKALHDTGTIPANLLTGFDALDSRTEGLVRAEVQKVAKAREERQKARIRSEKEHKDLEKRRAEAAKNAEKERLAQAQTAAESRLKTYMALLKKADVTLVDSVSVDHVGDRWEATITVQNIWHIRHKQIRLQDAQALWKVWAGCASPRDPDKAMIKIVDLSGNEVGGSRILGGSLIWVQD